MDPGARERKRKGTGREKPLSGRWGSLKKKKKGRLKGDIPENYGGGQASFSRSVQAKPGGKANQKKSE